MTSEKLDERVEVARGRYLTTEEVMALYRVSQRTVYRWKEQGKLHAMRAGRRLMFDPIEVEALIGKG